MKLAAAHMDQAMVRMLKGSRHLTMNGHRLHGCRRDDVRSGSRANLVCPDAKSRQRTRTECVADGYVRGIAPLGDQNAPDAGMDPFMKPTMY